MPKYSYQAINESGNTVSGDLEADSLDLVELIMAFEDEFGGEISDDEAQQIKTVGQAVEYLKVRMAAGGSQSVSSLRSINTVTLTRSPTSRSTTSSTTSRRSSRASR